MSKYSDTTMGAGDEAFGGRVDDGSDDGCLGCGCLVVFIIIAAILYFVLR